VFPNEAREVRSWMSFKVQMNLELQRVGTINLELGSRISVTLTSEHKFLDVCYCSATNYSQNNLLILSISEA
jgi:hypothetical protein